MVYIIIHVFNVFLRFLGVLTISCVPLLHNAVITILLLSIYDYICIYYASICYILYIIIYMYIYTYIIVIVHIVSYCIYCIYCLCFRCALWPFLPWKWNHECPRFGPTSPAVISAWFHLCTYKWHTKSLSVSQSPSLTNCRRRRLMKVERFQRFQDGWSMLKLDRKPFASAASKYKIRPEYDRADDWTHFYTFLARVSETCRENSAIARPTQTLTHTRRKK
jgi:hypothetical protein